MASEQKHQDKFSSVRSKTLWDVPTPALIVDLDRVERNCARMDKRAAKLGVTLRPHMKTAKSLEIGRLASRKHGSRITVSTVAEVAYFARGGFKDITYAVGIDASKVPAFASLQNEYGITVSLITDNVQAVMDAGQRAAAEMANFPIFIEIDCGGGRGGVLADSCDLVALAETIKMLPALKFAGVLTHAGQSYGAEGVRAIQAVAEAERAAVVLAASRIREMGIDVPCVSVGSTPTSIFAASMAGVTEMRPGVYTLCDLDQLALGTCGISDIAVSVLATVLGDNPRSERILIDAGGLALSKDLSAAARGSTAGFGLVSSIKGSEPLTKLRVAEVHQEHGLIGGAGSHEDHVAAYPAGSRVRILPNHACMTAAPYDRYYVVRGENIEIIAVWDKASGWKI
ncbi:alanine racemase [Parasphingorhabdus sp.]|uniref:alanine racemase n=1 Tax=Parasphingorhabdus sp. TaxID=2709688 RepID=UPI0032EF6F40